MNKKLLAVAVAGFLAAPAASMAAVKVTARIQGEISSVDVKGGFDGVRVQDAADSGGPNFLAFTGSEKLGNGWTAFGKINFNFDSTANGNIGQRDKFVGLKNDIVAVSIGRINSAYKKASVKYDPYLGTGLQARGNGGQSGGAGVGRFGHNSYIDDVVEVQLKAGAFSFVGQYVADEQPNADVGNAKDGSYSANIKYKVNSGLELIAATSRADLGGTEFDNYKAGAKWTSGPLSVRAEYENVEAGVLVSEAGVVGGNNNDDADIFFGAVTYKLGNITLASWVSYYDQDSADGVNYTVGGLYNFSKRARLHFGYRKLNVNGDVGNTKADLEEDVYAMGMRFVL